MYRAYNTVHSDYTSRRSQRHIFVTYLSKLSYVRRPRGGLPRPGLHFDRGSKLAVGNQVSEDLVQAVGEDTRFVHDPSVDRSGQRWHCYR